MKRTKLAATIVFLLCFLLCAHLAAFALRLYWFLWWYDGLLHFIAGIVLGLAYIYFVPIFFARRSRIANLLLFTLWIAAIGLGWEVFEYAYNISVSIEGYMVDTITDVVADTIGGILGYFMALRIIGRMPGENEK